jgi:hypothetical protein
VTGRWKLLTITVPAALAASLLIALFAEVWVRATWDPHKGLPGFFLTDAVRGQRLAAGYDGWFAGVPVHINSLELRDTREYELAKSPRTFRILVLGDSVTFGHGSVYEHTYPFLLEQRLRAWKPDVEWQVWNAAVPGYNTSQELAHLLEVGDRFKPDLVIVGFFENDIVGNESPAPPGAARVVAARLLSFAKRHVYSLELYKKVYLTLAWRFSSSDAYRGRLEHLGTEESLLSGGGTHDASGIPEQALTAFERLTDSQVERLRCVDGMTENAETLRAMERDPGYPAWIEAVRSLQRLNREGRFRVMFLINDAPATCGTTPEEDFFYDGGTRAIDRFYLRVMGDGTPAVSTYDAFLHVRPSQMPAARAHAIGNANSVKAEVLFQFLRTEVLPGALPPQGDRGSGRKDRQRPQ